MPAYTKGQRLTLTRDYSTGSKTFATGTTGTVTADSPRTSLRVRIKFPRDTAVGFRRVPKRYFA